MGKSDKTTIFLDVDGVLATTRKIQEYASKHKKPCYARDQLDHNCIRILKEIVDKLGDCDIVVSSTWRKLDSDMEVLTEELGKYDLKIAGTTKKFADGNRGSEIVQYIKDNNIDPVSIVIIDDSIADLMSLRDKLVRTNWYSGLVPSDVSRAMMVRKAVPKYIEF